MRAIFTILAFAAPIACSARLPPTLEPSATVPVRTADGWQLDLRHHGGDGPPVLLMHGMSANHYNWDYRDEISPIPALREAGYSVWVGALRGDPGTIAPPGARPTRITFDDHATHDAPALVDAVLAATGHPDLMWVGHSMGGMLLYTSALTHPEKIRAGVAVASPATFQTDRKNYAMVRNLGFLVAARQGRIPMRPMTRLGITRVKPLLRVLGNPDNLDPRIVSGMASDALENLPRATARQARQWMRARDLVRVDGGRWLTLAEASPVPLLVLGGADDRIAAEPDVAHACRIFQDCTYRLLSTSTGFSADYGHIDPVVGRAAPAEVYPIILDFLDRHRPDRQPAP
jgi:pimeloyl-ACP methyl ester carboxylesterase